jgi:hypothetical protein
MAMSTNNPPAPIREGCPVCGPVVDFSTRIPGNFLDQIRPIQPPVLLPWRGGLLDDSTLADKRGLVMEIIGIIRTEGRFEVNGLEAFWKRFDHHLCSSCRSKLERRQIGLGFVRYLLQEALRLDPGNDQARKNLDIIS